MSTQDLSGKIALVTGASRGIGAAIADTLAAAGAKVIGTATSESGAAAIGERLAQWGGEGRALNSAEPETIENLIADIEKEFGKLDILVNNAGITRDGFFHKMSADQWSDVIRVNMDSVFNMTRQVITGMRERNYGRIVNIASAHAMVGSPFKSAYVAAKHGLLGLTRVVALEAAEAGVTCNAVCPGYVRTPLVERQVAAQARAQKR